MKIVDLVMAFFELLEAEMNSFKNSFSALIEDEYKRFRETIYKTSLTILGVMIIGIMFFISLVTFAIGAFLVLNKFFGVILSLFLISFIFLIFGFILLSLLRKNSKE